MTEQSNFSPPPVGPARHPALILALSCAIACGSVALAGCATHENFSFLDGERWTKIEMNTYDTVILAVDGHSYLENSRIRIEPGLHHIVFQTKPAAGFTFSPRKTLDLDVEPCMRYWFEAKKANALSQDFEPRVNYKEPIGGCGTGAAS